MQDMRTKPENVDTFAEHAHAADMSEGHKRVLPDDRAASTPFWANNRPGLRAMLANAMRGDPDVTKGGR
jgi:hypothetical protein